jgi:hypothetical protein
MLCAWDQGCFSPKLVWDASQAVHMPRPIVMRSTDSQASARAKRVLEGSQKRVPDESLRALVQAPEQAHTKAEARVEAAHQAAAAPTTAPTGAAPTSAEPAAAATSVSSGALATQPSSGALLQTADNKKPPGRVRYMFSKLDKDSSGGIFLDELIMGFQKDFGGAEPLTPHVLSSLERMFEAHATADEGGESKSIKANVFSRVYAQALFAHFDKSNDGRLQLAEVQNALAHLVKRNADGQRAPPAIAYPAEFTDANGEVHLPFAWFWTIFRCGGPSRPHSALDVWRTTSPADATCARVTCTARWSDGAPWSCHDAVLAWARVSSRASLVYRPSLAHRIDVSRRRRSPLGPRSLCARCALLSSCRSLCLLRPHHVGFTVYEARCLPAARSAAPRSALPHGVRRVLRGARAGRRALPRAGPGPRSGRGRGGVPRVGAVGAFVLFERERRGEATRARVMCVRRETESRRE